MRPLGDELIRSACWSLERFVAPAVDDPLAASYLRAVVGLLKEAEVRSQFEWAALLEEQDELARLWPDKSQPLLPPPSSLSGLATRVEALRQPVADLVRSGQPVPEAVTDYLAHQLDRDERCSTNAGPAL
jgi:hypothetical protein